MSKSESKFPITPVDCSFSGKGLWLVKVPKYLAEKWNNASAQGNLEVGRIRITQPQAPSEKQDVVFHLNQNVAKSGSSDKPCPTEHQFEMTSLGDQTIYILKQDEEPQKETLSVIGKVLQKAECRPKRDDLSYLELKRKEVAKFSEPKKKIIQLEAPVVQNFMPRVHHVHTAEVKDKAKKQRSSKEEVQDILYRLFAKHQYYHLRDLERITKQPVGYLKEVLRDVCRVNAKGPHKNTWELKPEYRTRPAESMDVGK